MTPEWMPDGMAGCGRRVVGHVDVVRAWMSMVSRMSAIPKGAEWKSPMSPRVSIVLVVSRVSMMSEGMLDEKVGRDWHSVGEPKIAFQQELMSPNEGWSRWSRKDMRMTAVKTVKRSANQRVRRRLRMMGRRGGNCSARAPDFAVFFW